MKNSIFLTVSLFLLLCACGKSSLETTFANQSDKIDSYVTRQLESHPEYRVVYDEGVVRMIIAEGEGAELAKGGKVTFYYSGYNFNNTSANANTMYATNDPDIACASNWNLSDSTLFQGRDLYLLDTVEVGEYAYGSHLKRELIKLQLQ